RRLCPGREAGGNLPPLRAGRPGRRGRGRQRVWAGHVLRDGARRVHGRSHARAHAAHQDQRPEGGMRMETPALPTLDRRIAEPVVSEPVGALPATALETLTRSELDVQITTARRYPRSLALFKSTALSLVRLDQATAASCYYTLPRRQRQED